MKKLFEECKVLAKEHALNVRVRFPGAEEAGFTVDYNIEDSYEFEQFMDDLDENLSEKEKNHLIEEKKKKFKGSVRWHSSSLSCAMSYDEEPKDFED
jgi:hypothetical protein